jgi:hypothetical protein
MCSLHAYLAPTLYRQNISPLTPKMIESTADLLSLTRRIEEELAKRDALIKVLILYGIIFFITTYYLFHLNAWKFQVF